MAKSNKKKKTKKVAAVSRAATPLPSWLNHLAEGVVLIEDNQVRGLNHAAAQLLQVDASQLINTSLLAVLRDHRLEQVYQEGGKQRIETRGNILEARGIPEGLLLRDVSSEERAKGNARELLAVLSHELRTPVTTLRSVIEALKYDLTPEQEQRFLSRAEAEGARLTRLLDDLTVDVKPPKMRRLSLQEHIERALALLQDTFDKHHVSPLLCSANDLTVWADSDKLLQVLINLLENAAVHGPDGGAIHIVVSHDETMAHIAVRDQGEALADTVMQELFEAHSRGSSKAKGTGLGLYIVRSIANRWGGEAWGHTNEETETIWGNEFGFSVSLR